MNQIQIATVTSVSNNKIMTRGSSANADVTVCSPIGLHSTPQLGDQILILHGEDDRCYCIGYPIFSSTNSSSSSPITILDNGDVVINGITFSTDSTIKGATII